MFKELSKFLFSLNSEEKVETFNFTFYFFYDCLVQTKSLVYLELKQNKRN